MMYGGILPPTMKLSILQANSQLRVESHGYKALPALIKELGVEAQDAWFIERFKSNLRTLANISRPADELRVPLK